MNGIKVMEPTHKQIQIVFNWLMDDNSDIEKAGWWGTSEQVESIKELIRKLFQKEGNMTHGLEDEKQSEVKKPSDEQIVKYHLTHLVKDVGPDGRKTLKDELAKYPDPPGEEEFKGPYNGPDGEELRK